MNADDFNARYPVGTPVVAYPFIRPEHPVAVAYRARSDAGRTFGGANTDPCERLETVTRSKAWDLGHGGPVVKVEGYAGGITLAHVDIAPRTNTPDETVNENGRTVTRIKLKRACNGCGRHLGDPDGRDVDEHGNLTDIRAECPNCSPVVELEAAGCKTWQLTPRDYERIANQIDRLRPWIFTKSYWQTVDGELQVVGLRIGQYPDHVVAYFGDWIIRHPDRSFTTHKAPEQVTS